MQMVKASIPNRVEVRKPTLTPQWRLVRFLLSVLDPRAYLHALRLLNHYNQTHVIPRRSLEIGASSAVSPTSQFANPSRIRIGKRAHIGTGCFLWAGPNRGCIDIGDDLLLGPNVVITAANYRFRDGAPVSEQSMAESSIRIGNNVWVGAGAIVLPGSNIASHAVIAAGSVVRGNVGSGEVFAGVPARRIGIK